MTKYKIEEIEREIESLEYKFTEKINPTYDEVLKIKELREKLKFETRNFYIKEYFKIIADREMTEAEFKEYNEIIDNPITRKGYNLKNFIEGDKGSIWKKEDDTISQES